MIFLVAPDLHGCASGVSGRARHGFIYAVSRAGVTGAQTRVSSDAELLSSACGKSPFCPSPSASASQTPGRSQKSGVTQTPLWSALRSWQKSKDLKAQATLPDASESLRESLLSERQVIKDG